MKILLKCKTCGKVICGFEVKGQVDFDFTCPRCKQKNVGVIKDYTRKKINFMNRIDHKK